MSIFSFGIVTRTPGRRCADSLRARLRNAIELLEAHLTEPVDLDEAARRCGMSRWYFMRVFQAAAGLSVGEYVRMRRLSLAAEELAAGRPVQETAHAWGYRSQAAFTRTFSRTFGIPPASYARRAGAGGPSLDLLAPYTPELPPGVDDVPPPTTERREPFRLVGVRMQVQVFENRPLSAVPAFWADWILGQRWRALGVEGRPAFFGLHTVRVNGDLDYVLGIAAGPETPVPAGYTEVQVQGGMHAAFTAVGPPPVTSRALVFAAYGKDALQRMRGRRPGGWDIAAFEPDAALPAGTMRCRLWVPLREPSPPAA